MPLRRLCDFPVAQWLANAVKKHTSSVKTGGVICHKGGRMLCNHLAVIATMAEFEVYKFCGGWSMPPSRGQHVSPASGRAFYAFPFQAVRSMLCHARKKIQQQNTKSARSRSVLPRFPPRCGLQSCRRLLLVGRTRTPCVSHLATTRFSKRSKVCRAHEGLEQVYSIMEYF